MKEKLTEEQILEIGRTYGRTAGPTELAEKCGVSKQRIQQIAGILRNAGLPIPKIRLSRYKNVVTQLRKELATEEEAS